LLGQKSAIRPGSIFNRQGGSVFNQRQHGEDQLHRQWEEFLTPEEQKNALHLFIAPETSAGINAMRSDIWGGRLILRSWPNILSSLLHLREASNRGVSIWSLQVINFLRLLHLDGFQGFSYLSPPRHRVELGTPIFFQSELE
jgi:hypothetical protein